MWTVISDFIMDIRETGSRLLKNHRSGIWVTILTVILAYGFKLTHVSYNNDTSFALASLPLGLVSQKRFGHVIFSLSGILDQMVPFWSDMVGLLILLFAAFILRMTLERKFGDLFSPWKLTISSLLFLTYPLHMEFFLYPCGMVMMALGYTLTFTSVYFLSQQNRNGFFLSMLLLVTATGIYESFLFVFITTVLGIICIEVAIGSKKSLKDVLSCFGKICMMLLGALIIYGAIFFLLSLVYSLEGEGAAKSIGWLEKSFFTVLFSLFTRFGYDYLYNGLFYLPILVFIIVTFGVFILPVTRSFKDRRCLGAITLFCFLMSGFALLFLQGGITNYRSMQTLAVFVSLSCLLFMHVSSHPKWIMFLLFCIIFFQTKETNLISYTDWRTSENNIARIQQLVFDIRSRFGYIPAKPIYAVGRISLLAPRDFTLAYFNGLTKNLPRIHYTSPACSVEQFAGVGQFRLLVKHITNLDILCCNQGFFQQEKQQPQWPQAGYIQEYDDGILINLGPSFKEQDINRKQIQKDFINWWKVHLACF